MRTPIYTNKFEKDVKLCQKRGYKFDEFKKVLSKLINDEPLESKHRPHLLSGNYSGFWECHIKPDWLLIYQLSENLDQEGNIVEAFITFVRTGTHSDLF